VEPPAGTIVPSSLRLTHRSARRWLVAVGVAYAAVQLSFFDLDRAPSWDEAVYLSQVAPGAEAYHFTAWRARGITILVAPLATGPIPVVRVGLVLLAAVALVGAYLPWIRTVDTAAPVGAALFASGWTTLVYGSEAMPNLWVGFTGLAALGFATRPTTSEGRRRDDLAAAALLLVAALFRPFDAILLMLAVVVAAVIVGRRSVRTAGLLAVGAGAGCLVWLVEMADRYGGVRAALDQAMVVTRLSVPDPWERVVQYLATADGPSTGPVADPGIPIPGLISSLFAAVAAGAAVLDARGGSRSNGPLMTSLGGAALFGAAYVALVGLVAPRFLIPAAALLSVPMGRGMVVLWRRAGRPPLRAALVMALLAWSAWQGWVAVRLESSAAIQRAGVQDVGRLIGSLTGGRRCVVASVVGAPQIGFASGCRGRPIVDVGTVDEMLADETERGFPRVFLVLAEPLRGEPSGTSGRWTVEDLSTGPLTIYRVDP
jgi:hypothetical protein